MYKPPDIIVGVISDTHLPHRMSALPPVIFNIFQNVDLILHAGDVDKIDLLAPLEALAPLHAVRGNIHLTDLSSGGRNLPEVVELTLATHKIVVRHGHRPGLMGWLTKPPEVLMSMYPWLRRRGASMNYKISQRLKNQYPTADVIIFGHTHTAYCRKIDQTLCFNPGGVISSNNRIRSVGLLHIWPDKIEPYIVPIDQFDQQDQLKHWLVTPCTALS